MCILIQQTTQRTKGLCRTPNLKCFHSIRAGQELVLRSAITLSAQEQLKSDQERTPMVCVVVNTQATTPKMNMAISAIFFAGVLAQAL